ncbi:unnamed protein product [marine sediment metagenome]|uniref:Uncharacterized protein n=1 Tax=marine sediment metagenome TaxID=412755 RepID=X1N4W3_9ZZZZ
MITFKVVKRDNESIVLILRDDKLIATIYRHEEGVRLVSQYYDGVQSEPGVPPGVIIKFSEE